MNQFISITKDGTKLLICVDEIRAVGADKLTGKSRLVLDLARQDMHILVDQTVDQIEELLSKVAIVMKFEQDPLMEQAIRRDLKRR